jgi:hypothetical protein
MAVMQHAVLGDGLALLSLRVAAELDKQLGGKNADQAAFKEFRNELSKAATGPTSSPETMSYLQANPEASQVFARAICETTNRQLSDMAELVSALSQILSQIGKFETGESSTGDLSNMKRFCLSLHRSMMSQKLPPSYEGDPAFEGALGFVR